ncbi:tRNA threonylcarbamoyladenosine dehydratase [Paludibacteraceae bacterium OttesenSCG-928-F17]|nr:tRNA threonylcarbamoyladenosine dehydratase [Paludibacteraceae bacterium OttesenSCG-928-F17]
MENWTQRTEMIIGGEGLEKLSRSSVLVVGLGGVGAVAAEMICRAGVGKMTIIDRDDVSPTNINRQLVALNSTIGKQKAEVLAERLKDINPDLDLTVINDWLDEKNTEQILTENHFDFVVDAIDTISPKIFLIQNCIQKGIRIVSSMGSGGKLDPSQIQITDISKTEYCALAKTVRQRLSKLGIKKGLPVVFSTEVVDKSRVILVDDEKYKRSTTGTISYIPAMFGCFLASYVIRELIK